MDVSDQLLHLRHSPHYSSLRFWAELRSKCRWTENPSSFNVLNYTKHLAELPCGYTGNTSRYSVRVSTMWQNLATLFQN